MKKKTKILILQTGHAAPEIQSRFGDLHHHFESAVKEPATEFTTWPICDAAPPGFDTDPKLFSGIMVTGSAAMLGENAPWMKEAQQYIEKVLTANTPFLGVCFGHQLLAATLGSKVGPNPTGLANGTQMLAIQHHAPVFSDLESPLLVQVSHRDVILEPSASLQIIGTAAHDPNHAIMLNEHTFGVQFHPEWGEDLSRAYLELRRDRIIASESQAVFDGFLSSLAPSPIAGKILSNFVQLCRQNET